MVAPHAGTASDPVKFHPAGLLLAWGSALLLLQRLPLSFLPAIAFAVAALAFVLARGLYLSMLRRTRWLFLTLIVLFAAMTPGVFVPAPWNLGFITQEGLLAAAEHVLRLTAMLGLLALLLDMLDQRAIVAGLFSLLRPLARLGVDRERISVRLLLVLDHMAADRREWRELLYLPASTLATNTVRLPAVALRARDAMVMTLAVAITIFGWVCW